MIYVILRALNVIIHGANIVLLTSKGGCDRVIIFIGIKSIPYIFWCSTNISTVLYITILLSLGEHSCLMTPEVAFHFIVWENTREDLFVRKRRDQNHERSLIPLNLRQYRPRTRLISP